MAPAAAASKSFVLSAMLLCFHSGSLVCWLWRCAEALQLLQRCLSLLGAIPLRLCAFTVRSGPDILLFAPRLRVDSRA